MASAQLLILDEGTGERGEELSHPKEGLTMYTRIGVFAGVFAVSALLSIASAQEGKQDFSELDQDGDGSVSEDEYEQHKEQKKERRSGGY